MLIATNSKCNWVRRPIKMPEDNRDRRLDHLQGIIQRLATNSFAIRGWAVTLASAFLGFSIKDARAAIAFVGVAPIVVFWIIDAYYLWDRLWPHVHPRRARREA
jgi:hypothetical protein